MPATHPSSASGPPGRHTLWTAGFVGIIAVSFIGSLSNQALSNTIPLTVAAQGGTPLFSGILVAVFAISASTTRLLAGLLSDRRGRTRTLVLGAAVFLVGAAGITVVGALWALPLWRVLQGAGFALVSTGAGALAASVIPPARRGEGLGYYGLGQSLSMALGPALGIALLSVSAEAAFAAATGALAIALVLAVVLHRRRTPTVPPPPVTATGWWLFLERAALPVFWVQAVTSLGFSGYLNFLSLYAVDSGVGSPGVFFALAAVSTVASRLGISRVIDRWPLAGSLTLVYVVGAGSFVLLLAPGGAPAFYAAGVLFGLSFGLSMPLLGSLAISLTPPARWGAATATNYLGADVGVGVGGIVTGALVTVWGFDAFFGFGLAAMLAAFVLALLVLRRPAAAVTGDESDR